MPASRTARPLPALTGGTARTAGGLHRPGLPLEQALAEAGRQLTGQLQAAHPGASAAVGG